MIDISVRSLTIRRLDIYVLYVSLRDSYKSAEFHDKITNPHAMFLISERWQWDLLRNMIE